MSNINRQELELFLARCVSELSEQLQIAGIAEGETLKINIKCGDNNVIEDYEIRMESPQFPVALATDFERDMEVFLGECKIFHKLLSARLKSNQSLGEEVEKITLSLTFTSPLVSIAYAINRCPPGYVPTANGHCVPGPEFFAAAMRCPPGYVPTADGHCVPGPELAAAMLCPPGYRRTADGYCVPGSED